MLIHFLSTDSSNSVAQVFLENLIVAQLLNKLAVCMEPVNIF